MCNDDSELVAQVAKEVDFKKEFSTLQEELIKINNKEQELEKIIYSILERFKNE